MIRCLDDGTLLVNACIDLDDPGGALDIKLPGGRCAGLAGFLPEKTVQIPQVGSHSEYRKPRFTVVRGFARFVEEVKIN
jgi:CBS domain containing-hemolysin-like protein